MKILHTSDWHLGKKLYSRDRLPEQILVLDEIHSIAEEENVDCIVVAGDLFDVINPSNDANELFYKSIKKLSKNGKCPIIAIAGNHDSPDRIESLDPLARECGIILLGFPKSKCSPFKLENGLEVLQSDEGFLELKLPNCTTPLRIIATPYINEIRLLQSLGDDEDKGLREFLQNFWKTLAQKYCDDKGVNLLVAHLFVWGKEGELPEEPDGEKPIRIGNASIVYVDLIPEEIQYTALGHLHRSQFIDSGDTVAAYCGSPLAYSFKEAGQKKYVHIIEANTGEKVTVSKRELIKGYQLKKAEFTSVLEAIQWLEQNTEAFTEITMKTDTFLSPEEYKALREPSKNLLNIIPEPKNVSDEKSFKIADLEKSIEELFTDYFMLKKGQKPNVEIMGLLKEILNRRELQ